MSTQQLIGSASLTITDVNDAIISGEAPKRPENGMLWIDDSGATPVLKIYDNGSWVPQKLDVNNLDPDLAETITNVLDTLGTLADDGVLTFTDRKRISQEVAAIIGELPSKNQGNVYTNTLPTSQTLDSRGTGSFASLRESARNATVSTSNSIYIELRQAYDALNSYLSGLNPKPWDITETNRTTITEVNDPDEFSEALLNYYIAELRLATETEKRALEAAEEYTNEAIKDVIVSVDVEYAKNTSQNTAPTSTSEWQTNPPAWEDGSYIWSRTTTEYKDNTFTRTEPVNITGAKGASGSAGGDGRSISQIQEQYYRSDSATILTGGSWVPTPPEWKDGKFMWTRSVITFANPSGTHTTDPVSITGAQGPRGEQGPRGLQGLQGPEGDRGIRGPEGADGLSSYTHIAYAAGANGERFAHSSFSDATHIGMYVDTTEDSSENWEDYEWTLIKGKDGSQGLRGPEGKDGRTPYFHTAWANNSTGTSGFSTTVSTNKLYIGTATTFESDDPEEPSAYSWTRLKGDKGDTGAPGRSVTSVDVEYYLSTSQTTQTGGGWVTEPPAWKDGRFMWTRTKTTYSTGNPSTTTPVNVTGSKGEVGTPGTPGKSVSRLREQYYLSNSKTTQTGGDWELTQPTWEQGKYMWTRIEITYTNPSGTDYTLPSLDASWEAIDESIQGIGLRDKATLSGTEIFTDKADDSVVHLEIDGKSVGGGGNLLSNSYTTVSNNYYMMKAYPINDNSITENDTVTITLKGKLGSDRSYFRAYNSGGTSPSIPLVDIGDGYHRYTGKWVMPDVPSPNINLSLFQFASTGTASSTVEWIKMVRGVDNSLTYEPPTPTPNYPIEINSLNDFDAVSQKSEGGIIDGIEFGGRNLLQEKFYGQEGYSDYGWEFLDLADNRTLPLHYTGSSPFLEVGEYTLSFEMKYGENHSASTANIRLSNAVEGGSHVSIGYYGGDFTSRWKRVTHTFTLTEPARIGLQLYSRTNTDVYVKNLQLERGNRATDWTPAPEDITEYDNHPLIDKINLLLSEPLRSAGDVKDRLFRDNDGLWKVERNVEEYVFTDANGVGSITTNWDSLDRTTFSLRHFTNQTKQLNGAFMRPSQSLNSHFKVTQSAYNSGDIGQAGSSTKSGLYITVPNSIASTVGELIAWIESEANNGVPLTVTFAIEPTIETLSQELQDKLNNLRSFEESNYVYTIFPDKTDIISENLKPTLHATFKGGGWYRNFTYTNQLGQAKESLTSLENITLPALEDGLFNKAEKEAVRQSLNVVKADKSGIDAQYTAMYGNSSLIGTPKTNLYNAKVAYNTAYGNLVAAINTVLNVADGTRVTTAQYNNVQTRFTNYQNSLSTLRQRFEEALDAISGKKVDDSVAQTVASVDVEFAQNTSETTPPASTSSVWDTNPPTWIEGRFIWSRTVTVLKNGHTSRTNPVNITGAKGAPGTPGAPGSTGAAGRSISNIQEQYFLSTSRTSREGGSWVNTAPTWKQGMYMWTRILVTYANPSGTASTTPVIDTSWEAIDGIEVGGRNLILDSNVPVATSAYMVGEYFISEDFIEGATYTVTLKGTKLESQDFGLWQNSGSLGRGSLRSRGNNTWELTFTSVATSPGSERRVRIYQPVGATAGPATIDWIKLEKGNKATDWTPAPEDVQEDIDGTKQMVLDESDRIQSNYTTSIEETADAIYSFVGEEHLSQNEFTEYVEEINTLLTQTTEGWEFSFTNTVEFLEESIAAGVERAGEANKYIRFLDGSIILGEENSNSEVHIGNNKISFMQGGTEVASISEQEMNINHGIFVESLKVGEHKVETIAGGHTIWQWVPGV